MAEIGTSFRKYFTIGLVIIFGILIFNDSAVNAHYSDPDSICSKTMGDFSCNLQCINEDLYDSDKTQLDNIATRKCCYGRVKCGRLRDHPDEPNNCLVRTQDGEKKFHKCCFDYGNARGRYHYSGLVTEIQEGMREMKTMCSQDLE